MHIRSVLKLITNWLRFLVSITLIIFFSLTVTLSIIGRATINNLSSVSMYEQLIRETRLAERGRGLLANGLVSYGLYANQSTGSYISDHSIETWETVADVLVSDAWLEENLVLIINSTIEWLNDPNLQYPLFEIDMSPIISKLQSSQGALAIIPLFQGIQLCAPDVNEIVFMRDDLISCLPRDGNVARYGGRIAQILSNNIVPVISFQTLQQTEIITLPFIQFMGTLRNSFQTLIIGLGLGIQVSLLLFVLYALLWSRSPRSLLPKLPWPLYIAGGFSLLLIGLLQLFFLYGINNAIQLVLPFAAIEYRSLFVDILDVLSRDIKWQWFVWSIYLLIAGLFLHILIFAYGWVKKQGAQEIEPDERTRHRIRKQYR